MILVTESYLEFNLVSKQYVCINLVSKILKTIQFSNIRFFFNKFVSQIE